MSDFDKAALDRWLTTDPENQPDVQDEMYAIEQDEQMQETCPHPFISWHAGRGECQECGANIPLP